MDRRPEPPGREITLSEANEVAKAIGETCACRPPSRHLDQPLRRPDRSAAEWRDLLPSRHPDRSGEPALSIVEWGPPRRSESHQMTPLREERQIVRQPLLNALLRGYRIIPPPPPQSPTVHMGWHQSLHSGSLPIADPGIKIEGCAGAWQASERIPIPALPKWRHRQRPDDVLRGHRIVRIRRKTAREIGTVIDE